MFIVEGNRLIYRYDAEQLWIEPWGKNALRVRATKLNEMPADDWALSEVMPACAASIEVGERAATLRNGGISATVLGGGKLTIRNARGEILLEEYRRTRGDVFDPKCSAIEVEAREFKPIPGGDYHLTFRLESQDVGEKLFGMGQYQQPYLDLKGLDLELAQRNSQVSVPFLISSRGYGLLWNNPAIGRAVLGKHIMSFEAYATRALDFWVVAGDTPAALVEAYTGATGRPPLMPEYGLGFWQSKLRYQTQEELLEVAREYKRRKLRIDVIVADYFHWPAQGDWRFDPTYWPDPDAMVRELNDMGVQLMVSVWPTVDRRSENFSEMMEKGYLIRTERGHRLAFSFHGETVHADFTNPEARRYIWEKIRKNYADKGIRLFWLDVAEPEYSAYDFDNYRYHLGPDLRIGNLYPSEYAKTFFEGLQSVGDRQPVNLIRSAWAGSQKYGALVWSGDIASSFDSMRTQLKAGLNMGLAGIPWWTTDIGGFYGGNPSDPEFRELFARWFAWGAFLPVMRLHGDRQPTKGQQGTTGGACCLSGADNEVWSYGDEVLKICEKYLELRESMRSYVREQMRAAHEKGAPVIRPLFYDFPEDARAWAVEDQYMFGPDYLVAPVTEPGRRARSVYLPAGAHWKPLEGGALLKGGQMIEAQAPLDVIPVYIRA